MDSLIHFSQHVWHHTCCDNLCGLACMRVSFDVGAGRAFVQAGPSCTMATYHTILASFTETAAGCHGGARQQRSVSIIRGRWQLTTTAGSMQASPSLTLVVWFAIAIVGGGRRIQLASRGGVETSPNACRGPRQNYRFGAIAPGTILSSKDPLRGCNTKKGRAERSETSRGTVSHICAFRKVAI